jgi:hypothetical protein
MPSLRGFCLGRLKLAKWLRPARRVKAQLGSKRRRRRRPTGRNGAWSRVRPTRKIAASQKKPTKTYENEIALKSFLFIFPNRDFSKGYGGFKWKKSGSSHDMCNMYQAASTSFFTAPAVLDPAIGKRLAPDSD